jgi:hypothetical protein
MSHRRFKFSVAFLLLSTTVVALFFGYAQWRRQKLVRVGEAIKERGFTLIWEEGWTDTFWFRMPKQVRLEFSDPTGPVDKSGPAVRQRLYDVGVDEVVLVETSRNLHRPVKLSTRAE